MVDNEQMLSEAAPSIETNESLGDVLRKARAAHDLTLDQLATELRIEARQLQALEENRFEQIGVPVFVKGYLRQYGHRLGLDHGDLLALYYKQTKLTEIAIQPSKTIRLRDERQITLWIVALVILAALGAGLAYYWYSGSDFLGRGVGSGSGDVTGAAPAAVPESADSVPESTPDVRVPGGPPPPAESASLDRVGAAGEPAASPRSDEAAQLAAPPVTAAAEAPPVAASAEPASQPTVTGAGSVAIELAFDAESWAEVTDAQGARLFYSLGVAGQRAMLRGDPPFTVVIGNAPAVRLVVDGAPYPIPQEGRQGNLARFSIDTAEE